MSDVPNLFDAAAAGDREAAAELLPLIYDELRALAATRLASEDPGQTLQATALVHEAYLRLIGPEPAAKREKMTFACAISHSKSHCKVEEREGHVP